MCAMRCSPASLLCAALLLGLPFPSLGSDSEGPPPPNPRRLLLMVQYVGTDYGNAVGKGKILDQAEYDEALQNMQEARRMYGLLMPGTQGTLGPALEALQKLVEKKAEEPRIQAAVTSLVPELTKQLKLSPVPVDMPDLAVGKQKFEMTCAVCHGMTGKGDGPGAANLKPPPPAMAEPGWADGVAPFQIFNTVTMGLPGTAMASFAADLTYEERWSVAFFVLNLRQPASPAALHPALPVRELSAFSNRVLADRLRKSTPSLTAEAALAAVDGARRVMPPIPTVAQSMAALSDAARKAETLVKNKQNDAALDLIRNTYMDMVEPVEAPLRKTLPGEVSQMEAAVTALRRVISQNQVEPRYVEAVVTAAGALAQRHTQPDPPKLPLATVEQVEAPPDGIPTSEDYAFFEDEGDIKPHRVMGALGLGALVVTLLVALMTRMRR